MLRTLLRYVFFRLVLWSATDANIVCSLLVRSSPATRNATARQCGTTLSLTALTKSARS